MIISEDLDAAEAELVVLGRERILIDADLADGVLGGDLAAAESIDEDGASIRTGGGSGERLEVGGEVVRIVGERLQVLSPQDDGAGVGGSVSGDGRRAGAPARSVSFTGRGRARLGAATWTM